MSDCPPARARPPACPPARKHARPLGLRLLCAGAALLPAQAVLSVDPGIPFVDTSPSNGLLSRQPYAKR